MFMLTPNLVRIYRSLSNYRSAPLQLDFLLCSLSSQATDAIDGENFSANAENATTSLSSRIERLPKSSPVGLAFQGWLGDGNPIQRCDIFHAINRLRMLNLNKRAFEVMEWVIRERPYKPKELEYSYLLEFTIKHHGISQGEKLFCCIPPAFQNDLLYNNLVIACLEKGAIKLSLCYMKKMRQLGHHISHLPFNRLLILHSHPRKRRIIPKILAQMKADHVTPHVSTYNILMKIEANEHNIDALCTRFTQMKHAHVTPNEITFCILATAHVAARLYTVSEAYIEGIEASRTGNRWSTLEIMIGLYGYLGKENEIERTWKIIQELPYIRPKSYVHVIQAFGRSGNLERAEELWIEMKSTKGLKSTEQFNSIIYVYCKHGEIGKAIRFLKEMGGCGCKANAITFRNLAFGCLKVGLLEKALKMLEMGAGLVTSKKVRNSLPWLEITLSIVELFAEMGDLENAEKLFKELEEMKYTRHTFVYNTLIMAYVSAKVHDPTLLRRMVLGGARPNDETYSLLKLNEQFLN